MKVDCHFCHDDLDTGHRSTVRQEKGWNEINRTGGGGHNLIGRTPVVDTTGRYVYAHKSCAQSGIKGQAGLFGTESNP